MLIHRPASQHSRSLHGAFQIEQAESIFPKRLPQQQEKTGIISGGPWWDGGLGLQIFAGWMGGTGLALGTVSW